MTEPITPEEFEEIHWHENLEAYKVCHAAYLRERERVAFLEEEVKSFAFLHGAAVEERDALRARLGIVHPMDQAARKEGV